METCGQTGQKVGTWGNTVLETCAQTGHKVGTWGNTVMETCAQTGHKVGTWGNAVAVKVGVLGFRRWELTSQRFQLLPLLTDLFTLLAARGGKKALAYMTTPTSLGPRCKNAKSKTYLSNQSDPLHCPSHSPYPSTPAHMLSFDDLNRRDLCWFILARGATPSIAMYRS